jgi:acyl dehydratase
MAAPTLTINESELLAWEFPTTTVQYRDIDVMLYALGVGLGADPTDEHDLRFVYEKNLRVLPTIAAVLGHPGPWFQDPRTGIDWVNVVHGEQSLILHMPLAPADSLVCRTRVTDIEDKGEGRGALVSWRRTLHRESTGEHVATLDSVLFCRNNGGFGGERRTRRQALTWPQTLPTAQLDFPVSPRAGLIYRLSGDRNQIHVDPSIAATAGFDKPILHGLCTFAIATYAVIKRFADYDVDRLSSVSARFRAPVFPGETLRTQMWVEGEGCIRFRSVSLDRDLVVLDAGVAELGGSVHA